MLTVGQRNEFVEFGLIHLPGAVARSDAAKMCDLLWATLAKQHNMHRDAPETWNAGGAYGIQAPARSGVFSTMGSVMVRSALDGLFGPGSWEQPRYWGQHLVTFPSPGERWDVPYASWHLDAPAPSLAPKLPGVIVFVFRAPVLDRGGGTVILAGSHRLVEAFAASADPSEEGRSADVRKAFNRTEPWLRALWSRDDRAERVQRFMIDGAVIRGISVKLVELTGEAVDAIIWRPWLFHAAASNCRSLPPLMLKQPIIPTPGVEEGRPGWVAQVNEWFATRPSRPHSDSLASGCAASRGFRSPELATHSPDNSKPPP